MKFNNVMEMIEKPALGTYVAQIKSVRNQLQLLGNAPEDGKKRIELNKQIQALTRSMNDEKKNQTLDLQNKQKALAQANTAV